MKQTLMLVVLLVSGWAQAQSRAEIPSQEIITELRKFKGQKGTLPEDYVSSFPQTMQTLVNQAESESAKIPSNCADNTQVQFVKSLTGSDNPVIREFEGNFIKIEVYKCLKDASAEKVESVLTSDDFKNNAYKVAGYVPKGNGKFCEKSSVPTKGEASYCYYSFTEKENDHYLKISSLNYWNESVAPYNMEIYFRQTMMGVRQVNHDVQFHAVTYYRGLNLGILDYAFAKQIIGYTQDKMLGKLNEYLRKP